MKGNDSLTSSVSSLIPLPLVPLSIMSESDSDHALSSGYTDDTYSTFYCTNSDNLSDSSFDFDEVVKQCNGNCSHFSWVILPLLDF